MNRVITALTMAGGLLSAGTASAAAVTGVAVDAYEVYTELTVTTDKAAAFTCEAGGEPHTLVLTVAAAAPAGLTVAPAGRVAVARVAAERGATTFILKTGEDVGSFRAYATKQPPAVVVDIYRKLELTPKRPPRPYATAFRGKTVLLVDDDDGPDNGNKYSIDVDDTYKAAMKRLGLKYDIHIVRTGQAGPNAAKLAPYPLVIWYCGLDARPAVITAADEGALLEYINGGGRVVLICQNYLSDSSNQGRSRFCREGLGITGMKADTQVDAVRPGPTITALEDAEISLNNELTRIGNWGDAFVAPDDACVILVGKDGKTYAEVRRASAGGVAFFAVALENMGYASRVGEVLAAALDELVKP